MEPPKKQTSPPKEKRSDVFRNGHVAGERQPGWICGMQDVVPWLVRGWKQFWIHHGMGAVRLGLGGGKI